MANNLSREQAAVLLELLKAAQAWRKQMVYSNGPYPNDDGRAFWAKVNNPNGHLVKAVDAATDLLGDGT